MVAMAPAEERKLKFSIYRYRWKWLKNKSMLIVFLWCFTVSFVLNFILSKYLYYAKIKNIWHAYVGMSMAIIFPFTGWITDIYIGRYKCIKSGLNLMFIGTALTALFEVLRAFHHPDRYGILINVSLFLGLLGFFGFQTNIIQFCLDQLSDSSPGEIISFICVYIWSFIASSVLVEIILQLSFQYHNYNSVGYIALPILLAASLCCDILFHYVLIKEPVSHNPLKLIFQVLKYAAKTKYPRLRSSFTYWEDKPYSRIDLAKARYGGPFTVEQVEDVKTFFRIAIVIGLGALFFAVIVTAETTTFILYWTDLCPSSDTSKISNLKSLRIFMLLNSGNLVAFLGTPAYELFVFPICMRCLQRLTILSRIVLGMVLMLLAVTQFIAFGLAKDFVSSQAKCTLSPCLSPVGSLAYWYGIYRCVNTLGKYIFMVASIEFICAQAPYSMKGLLFGYSYSCVYLGASLVYTVFVLPFHVLHDSLIRVPMECLFWFLFSCTAFAGIVFIVFCVVSCFYKNRLREDTLPNQQYFAEQYYDSIYNVTEHV